MPFYKGHKQSNTGRTHFKKGQHPSPATQFKKGHPAPKTAFRKGDERVVGKGSWNWKGGITKLKGYSSIYKKRHRARKKNAEGLHTQGEWDLLKIQYGYTCPCCGRKEPEIKLTEDHIIPLSKGGSDYIENIQPLCKSCNCKKHDKFIKY